MIHFGGYILDAMDFDEVTDETTSITFTPKSTIPYFLLVIRAYLTLTRYLFLPFTVDRFPYPTYAEVFGGMYTNYAMISTILSLKACIVYYGDMSKNVIYYGIKWKDWMKGSSWWYRMQKAEKCDIYDDKVEEEDLWYLTSDESIVKYLSIVCWYGFYRLWVRYGTLTRGKIGRTLFLRLQFQANGNSWP